GLALDVVWPTLLQQGLEVGVADAGGLREQFLGLIDGELRLIRVGGRRQRDRNEHGENESLHPGYPHEALCGGTTGSAADRPGSPSSWDGRNGAVRQQQPL